MFLVIFSLMNTAIRFAFPWIYKYIFDEYIPSYFAISILYHIIIIVMLLSTLEAVSNFVMQVFSQKIKIKLIESIRVALLDKMLLYKYSFFLSSKTGDLINHLIPEIDTLSNVLVNLFILIIAVLQIIGLFTILFLIDKQLCLLFVIILIFCFIWTYFFKKRIVKYGLEIMKIRGRIYSFFFELFPKIKEIKAYNMYDFLENQLGLHLKKNKTVNVKSSVFNSFYSLVS